MEYEKLLQTMECVHSKHAEGFNCAESVYWGVCRLFGLDASVSCVTGFGGGIARGGSVCGALLGAIAAVGSYVGRTEPADDQGKAKCYKLGSEVVKEFSKEMNTTICREILGFTLDIETGIEQIKKESAKAKCEQAITVAIEAALKAIKKSQCE